jgi:hypothetical protein
MTPFFSVEKNHCRHLLSTYWKGWNRNIHAHAASTCVWCKICAQVWVSTCVCTESESHCNNKTRSGRVCVLPLYFFSQLLEIGTPWTSEVPCKGFISGSLWQFPYLVRANHLLYAAALVMKHALNFAPVIQTAFNQCKYTAMQLIGSIFIDKYVRPDNRACGNAVA